MLPRRVQVRVKNTTEGGFVAELPEYGIFTQASTVPELVYMVNDAIFTYFDVSVEDRKHLPYFVPHPNLTQKNSSTCSNSLVPKHTITDYALTRWADSLAPRSLPLA